MIVCGDHDKPSVALNLCNCSSGSQLLHQWHATCKPWKLFRAFIYAVYYMYRFCILNGCFVDVFWFIIACILQNQYVTWEEYNYYNSHQGHNQGHPCGNGYPRITVTKTYESFAWDHFPWAMDIFSPKWRLHYRKNHVLSSISVIFKCQVFVFSPWFTQDYKGTKDTISVLLNTRISMHSSLLDTEFSTDSGLCAFET